MNVIKSFAADFSITVISVVDDEDGESVGACQIKMSKADLIRCLCEWFG